MPAGRVQQLHDSDNAQPKDVVTFTGIRTWVPIIISLLIVAFGLVGTWVGFDYRLQKIEAEVVRIDTKVSDHLQDVAAIKAERDEQYRLISVSLAGIEAQLAQTQLDILYIRRQLDSHISED